MNSSSWPPEITSLFKALDSDRVVFVLGSGICYEADVPSAALFLGATLRAHLFEDDYKQLEEVLGDEVSRRHPTGSKSTPERVLQPEMMYESLLRLGAKDCLNVWGILEDFRNPTLAHHLAVAVAHRSNAPIITPNFDLLFETAAHQQELDTQVFTNRPNEPLRSVELGFASIWKVHGSIGAGVAELGTTISTISRRSEELVRGLSELAVDSTLLISGYSGRDVDLFPELVRQFKDRPVYWLDESFKTETKYGEHERARAIDAIRVPAYLSTVGQLYANSRHIDIPEPTTPPATPLPLALPPRWWDEIDSSLFLSECLHAASEYREAAEVLADLESAVTQSSRELQELHYWRLRGRSAHERNQFYLSELSAKRGIKKSRMVKHTSIDDLPAFRELFQCMRAESIRMQFANDPYSRSAPSWWYATRAFLSMTFQTLRLAVRHRAGTDQTRFTPSSSLQLAADSERIEHSIRYVAFIQGAFDRVGIVGNRWLRRWLVRWWDVLQERSERVGYAAGIANVEKYRGRLHADHSISHPELVAEGQSIFEFLNYSTGQQLIVRDWAAASETKGDLTLARLLYEVMWVMASDSGALLNEAKAILGLSRLSTGTSGRLPMRIRRIASQLDSPDWTRFLQEEARTLEAQTAQ